MRRPRGTTAATRSAIYSPTVSTYTSGHTFDRVHVYLHIRHDATALGDVIGAGELALP